MNAKQLRTLTAVLAALILALVTGSAMAANQKEVNGGKKAEIVLTIPAHVGDVVLPAGHYVFQHMVSAGQHVATFAGPEGTASTTSTEVKCTNEILPQRVRQTSVTVENVGGVNKITRIEIAGETVAHIFS
jgi:hypothetical protein